MRIEKQLYVMVDLYNHCLVTGLRMTPGEAMQRNLLYATAYCFWTRDFAIIDAATR